MNQKIGKVYSRSIMYSCMKNYGKTKIGRKYRKERKKKEKEKNHKKEFKSRSKLLKK